MYQRQQLMPPLARQHPHLIAFAKILSLTPAGVWNFYEGRAGMEPRIRELREDYALRKIPTRAFAANALRSVTSVTSGLAPSRNGMPQ